MMECGNATDDQNNFGAVGRYSSALHIGENTKAEIIYRNAVIKVLLGLAGSQEQIMGLYRGKRRTQHQLRKIDFFCW